MERRNFLQVLVAGAAALAAAAISFEFSRLLPPGGAAPRRIYLRPPEPLVEIAERPRGAVATSRA